MSALSALAADVRITEVDLSSSLVQNSNIRAALAVVSSQGPVGPTQYTSFDTFRSDFGDPNASISFDHYAANDFFKDGNALWAVRAVGTGANYGALTLYVDSVSHLAGFNATTPTDPTNIDWTTVASGTQLPIYTFYPRKGPGSYSSNIAIAIKSDYLAAPTMGTGSSVTGGSIVAGTYNYQVAAFNSYGEFLASSVLSFTTVATGSNVITWNTVVGATGYYIYGRATGGSFGYIDTVGTSADNGFGVCSYTDTGTITPNTTRQPVTVYTSSPYPTSFTVQVYDLSVNTSTPVESFDCTVGDGTDEMGLATETTQRIGPFSAYIGVTSNVPNLITVPRIPSASQTAMSAGSSGAAVTSSQINAAFDLLQDKERYVIDVMINAGRGDPVVQQHMDSNAQSRFDCVAFLDVPSTNQTANSAIDFRNITLNLNSSFSALFCSDLYESDPISGKLLFIPPSGAMAGLMARTTRVAQSWFSQAGLNRGLLDVLDVRYTYNDGDATNLYQAQINYMRKFIGKGIALWEQSTLYNKASALQFLNVRVLCNVIKRSMYNYLIYSLQEPGDDILRKQITYGLTDYLSYVQGARGISSFSVVCDSTNNTPAVVNSGSLAVAVYIVPILAVRQIALTLLVGKQGLTLTESDISAISN